MADSGKKLKNKIDALRDAFVRRIPERIDAVENLCNSLREKELQEKEINELHRLVHNLSSSCSVFGLKKTGTAAREFELLLKGIMRSERGTTIFRPEIDRHLEALKQSSKEPFAPENFPEDAPTLEKAKTAQVHPHNERRDIFILNDSFDDADKWSRLSDSGYRISLFTEPTSLVEATRKQTPSAIISIYSKGILSELRSIPEFNPQSAPLIYVSHIDTLETRLDAVREGGEAFFPCPPDMAKLTERLDALTTIDRSDPYRILIVDDEPEVASYYAAFLEEKKMSTLSIDNPMMVVNVLKEFNPDLILMDMYMPGCNGMELAKAIRQMDDYIGIPIVFLSVETDISKQLYAMSTGADDFISKSTDLEHLFSSVSIRAERMRMLRKLNKLVDYSHILEKRVEERTSHLQKANMALKEKSVQLEELNRSLENRVKKEVDKRRENEQLMIQQSNMAAMGEMLALIAHQWRQPLNAVGIIVQDILDSFDFGSLDKTYLEKTVDEITNQVTFMSNTIDDFMYFLEPTKEMSLFNVKDAVDNVLSILSALIKKNNIKVVRRFKRCTEEDIPRVNGYPNEFKHVILNIINNSKFAILRNREKKVLSRNEAGMIEITFARRDNVIRIQIEDNGGGVPDEIGDRIFDRYFTTKGKKGTGAGLYMAKTIIEKNMGGKLSYSNTDKGAVFTLELKTES